MDRKLKALEALRDGATTLGERDAAQMGIDRILRSKKLSHNVLRSKKPIVNLDPMTGGRSFNKFHLYGTRRAAWNTSEEAMGRTKDHSLSATLGDLIKKQRSILCRQEENS